jgi:hypothetical protein
VHTSEVYVCSNRKIGNHNKGNWKYFSYENKDSLTVRYPMLCCKMQRTLQKVMLPKVEVSYLCSENQNGKEKSSSGYGSLCLGKLSSC